MAFELITGHAGRNHVDSADMGEAFAGIVGKGRYILDTGEGMACAMSDSNTLTVGTGSMLMDGRIVRNETAATFKIANGTQGQYRHDLACLRYKLDRSNDSIESVEQVVLQGTPATTADEAKDPDYEAGDILSGDLSATVPIARVKLDSLTPTCEAMLGSVTSLKALGESVSQETVLDGSVNIYGSVIGVRVLYNRAAGLLNVMTARVDGYMNTGTPGYKETVVGTIGKEFRPVSDRTACLSADIRNGLSESVLVKADGTVSLRVWFSVAMVGFNWGEPCAAVPLL